jgi:hypothetical protein
VFCAWSHKYGFILQFCCPCLSFKYEIRERIEFSFVHSFYPRVRLIMLACFLREAKFEGRRYSHSNPYLFVFILWVIIPRICLQWKENHEDTH